MASIFSGFFGKVDPREQIVSGEEEACAPCCQCYNIAQLICYHFLQKVPPLHLDAKVREQSDHRLEVSPRRQKQKVLSY